MSDVNENIVDMFYDFKCLRFEILIDYGWRSGGES